jgi:predicted nucleic acid-binding protein
MRSVLIDNSAWSRLRNPTLVPMGRRREVAAAIEAGEVYVCAPFLLEACYSARDALEHDELLCELLALPSVAMDAKAEQQALEAQSQLARVGHHRLPPIDLFMAALAARHGLDLLHYDSDYDIISSKTDLGFGSEWLVARGSLGR